MSVTTKNILRHELIGLEAQVISSSDHTLLGTFGKILDETRGILVIEHLSDAKFISKSGSTFEIRLPDGQKVAVKGDKLVGRPAERVRRKR